MNLDEKLIQIKEEYTIDLIDSNILLSIGMYSGIPVTIEKIKPVGKKLEKNYFFNNVYDKFEELKQKYDKEFEQTYYSNAMS